MLSLFCERLRVISIVINGLRFGKVSRLFAHTEVSSNIDSYVIIQVRSHILFTQRIFMLEIAKIWSLIFFCDIFLDVRFLGFFFHAVFLCVRVVLCFLVIFIRLALNYTLSEWLLFTHTSDGKHCYCVRVERCMWIYWTEGMYKALFFSPCDLHFARTLIEYTLSIMLSSLSFVFFCWGF